MNIARLLYITEGNAPPFNGREKSVQFFISNLKVFQSTCTSLRFHTIYMYDHQSIFFIHAKIYVWNCLQMGSIYMYKYNSPPPHVTPSATCGIIHIHRILY